MIRTRLDISSYLVVGSENCSRPVEDVIAAAVDEGFTCVQIRSKISSAREMISLLEKAAQKIFELGKSETVALLVDDRLDVVLAARELGIKVDGVHVGQNDIPAEVCRKFLGNDSIVGLSASSAEEFSAANVSIVDYFGVGPLHSTATKNDAGSSLSFEKISALAKVSPLPIVVGGGVKLEDIPKLKAAGVAGFFVVSAVTNAPDERLAARELVDAWKKI